MKIKLDENIPTRLIADLAALGHEVDSVMQEDLTGHPDPEVWSGAQASKRLLITQDLDFSDIRDFQPGTHYGIILVRLRKPGRKAVARRVLALFMANDIEQWARCFVVVTDLKIRIHRPT